MQKIEIEAKSIEEATKRAAQELHCNPNSLKVKILEEKKGFLGVGRKIKISASFGGNNSGRPGNEDAVFNLTEKSDGPMRNHEPPATCDEDQIPSWAMNPDFDPRQALENICQIIIPECNVETSEREGRLLLDIQGDGSGIFIGRKGHTLEALQFIINKMYLKQTGRANHIIVDSEGYTSRRIEKLQEKAELLANKAINIKHPQTTEPLNAHDRRIIHTAVRNLNGISTRSIGNGEFKRVQISSKNNRR